MHFRVQRASMLQAPLFLFVGLAASGCANPASELVGECEPGVVSDCPPVQQADGGDYAEFCAITEFGGVCTNVCDFASNQVGAGNEGDFCEFDSNCNDGLTCDNDTIGAEMPCRCIVDEGGNGPTDCSDVTPGNGGFGEPCRNNADCNAGLPCCTSTEVSEACGVEVGFCECI